MYAGEGEPLLHPDIEKFVTHSKKKGIDAGIYPWGSSEMTKTINCKACLRIVKAT